MRIENEMLSRFNSSEIRIAEHERTLSTELDFFFDNVMDTVVEFFTEKEESGQRTYKNVNSNIIQKAKKSTCRRKKLKIFL